jgi:hypothetical protein
MRPSRRIALLLLLSIALSCAHSRTAWRMRVRGTSTEFTVERAVPRGGYLDVALQGQGALRTFIPDTNECRRVAKGGAKVRYEWDGALGSVNEPNGTRRCQAVGVGTLTEWRVTRPEDPGMHDRRGVMRELARYRVVYRDRDVILARGYFPLTRHLGWVGPAEAIVVMKNTPACMRGPAALGTASLEYFPSGERVLGLVAKDRWCDVDALLLPLAANAR